MCAAKLATTPKRGVLKQINKRAKKTHGKMIFSGWDPEYTLVNGEKSTRRNIIALNSALTNKGMLH
jgi:hypothetical protein